MQREGGNLFEKRNLKKTVMYSGREKNLSEERFLRRQWREAFRRQLISRDRRVTRKAGWERGKVKTEDTVRKSKREEFKTKFLGRTAVSKGSSSISARALFCNFKISFIK